MTWLGIYRRGWINESVVMAGSRLLALLKELTAAGHRTKRGGRWHGSTVHAIWRRRAAYRALLAATPTHAAG
jgi:hypothetical protein